MEVQDKVNNDYGAGETLEAEPVVDSTSGDATPPSSDDTPPPPKPNPFKKLLGKFNIYLLGFIFILIIAAVIVFIAFSDSKKQVINNPKSSGLSNSTLQQIANGDTSVGGPQQVLNVQSNAVFAGKVLVNQSLDVAGGLQVTGDVGIQNLNVTGTADLQSATIIKDLSVGGNLSITGTSDFNGNLQVNGSGTFSGSLSTSQLTTSSLQLNGELVLDHHLSVGGAAPSGSSGAALGSGGTASVNGSDTAGALTLNIGSNPAGGCFISVKFNQAYNQTPYVIVSPVGSSGAGLPYFVTANTTSFSLCVTSAAPANTSFSFDYFVVE